MLCTDCSSTFFLQVPVGIPNIGYGGTCTKLVSILCPIAIIVKKSCSIFLTLSTIALTHSLIIGCIIK